MTDLMSLIFWSCLISNFANKIVQLPFDWFTHHESHSKGVGSRSCHCQDCHQTMLWDYASGLHIAECTTATNMATWTTTPRHKRLYHIHTHQTSDYVHLFHMSHNHSSHEKRTHTYLWSICLVQVCLTIPSLFMFCYTGFWSCPGRS